MPYKKKNNRKCPSRDKTATCKKQVAVKFFYALTKSVKILVVKCKENCKTALIEHDLICGSKRLIDSSVVVATCGRR